MIRMSLSEAAQLLDAEIVGSDAQFQGVGSDTRTLPAGALFVALKGARFDGHEFLAEAAARGAAGALVSEVRTLPCLRVADTRAALTRLAAAWRSRFSLPLVAVTGSNGKTTVKDMLASILRQDRPTLATEGNLNNDLGVPLMLLRLGSLHGYAVIEMGANHAGEIAHLSRLARPGVCVITNAGPAHLEGFGSIEGVARAKGEILQGLDTNGTAVLNADDAYADYWRGLAGSRRVVSFGLAHPADVTASELSLKAQHSEFLMHAPVGTAQVSLPLAGRHNVMNALAAAAAAFSLGVSIADIALGLSHVSPAHGRFEAGPGRNGCCVIDDTYNANPGSVASGLAALAAFPGEKVLVLGDMAELGERAEEWHAEIGRRAREAGVARLLTIGSLGAAAARSFGPGGLHFADRGALIAALEDLVHADMTLLVKGSRCMGMEQVVQALRVTHEHTFRPAARA